MRVQRITQFVFIGLLVFILWWRWQISQTRFFDVDEFSYLHWAAELVKGSRPYVDFFMFFTPGFLWLFAPLVKVFWMSADVFIAARIVAFAIFLGILGSLGILFGKTRGWKWALLPVVLLAFLPMPYDKFLEIRPDNLATLIGLIGLIWQIGWLQNKKTFFAFLSGFFYSLSLLVFVKTLPFVIVGAIVALFAKNDKKLFFLGFLAPVALFFLWALTLGDIGNVWYSLTKLPFEANMIGTLDIMEPHLFFFPNPSFYGAWGITLPLILNHAIWIVGATMGVIRFFTPFITAEGDRKKVLVEVLVSGTFLLLVAGYVQFFPLKHSQYLIPIAIFIAYYAADGIYGVLRPPPLRIFAIRRSLSVIGVVLTAYVLSVATVQTNQIKLGWTNEVQLSELQKLTSTIDPKAEILDLEGRLLYWKDAYYTCCVSFGSFEGFLSKRPPPVRDVLEANGTPFIWQGDTERLGKLSSADQIYIRDHYVSVEGWGEKLFQRKP